MSENSNSKSNLISDIQGFLINIRNIYPSIPLVSPTGLYDQETREAIIAFQKIKGLPITGSINIPTWLELINENDEYLRKTQIPARVPLSPSSFKDVKIGYQGDIVYAIKVMLNSFNKKYANYMELEISNLFDSETEKAVKIFQERSMLPATGVIDMVTWNTLVDIYDCCKLFM